jgi:small subunit ribosomal protein S3
VPLDYGFAEARTLYGIIGIKCWVNKKEDDGTGKQPQGRSDRGGDRRGGGGDRGGDRRPNNRN